MLKIAELLEPEIEQLDAGDADQVTAAAAVDFAAYDSDDLARVAALLTGFADAFDSDGRTAVATAIDGVLSKIAGDPRFFMEPRGIPGFKPAKPDRESLGDIGHSLQTRHSPDLPGVSLVRVDDGVYRDPMTNKTYDFNRGFTLDDGTHYAGGSVSAQTVSGPEIKVPIKQQITLK